ncbi:hypothetical protein, partial [Dermacoccus nishinomiyaensis]|uniref:hypothetical protein n=1 Tax=Dermacoccus nishinomiyaensis TaxID=1274 RepID=UPI0021A4A8F9
MNHEHRQIPLAERLTLTLGAGISLAVMAVVLIRMASTGAHPVAVCLMAAALVGACPPTLVFLAPPACTHLRFSSAFVTGATTRTWTKNADVTENRTRGRGSRRWTEIAKV